MTRLLLLALAAACAPPQAVQSGSDAPATAPGDDTVDHVAGAQSDPDAFPGSPEDLYPSDRVVEIAIELDDADWAALRRETRSMFDVLAGDCMEAPAESPYSWFRGSVTIDGEAVPDVAVRKKGFIGSLSITKPGMKIDFDRFVETRRFHGLERLTLNNTPQDPTMLRTCLAYEAHRAIGNPAPQCGFAHVTVNGEDLGIYANVEPIDDHFAERALGEPDVPLFEGTLSDFRDGWTGTFDPDSPEADPALLEPITAAVESGDPDRLAEVVDLEAFARFMVGEALTGHWDGYGWNTNNYYVALRPSDGRAVFLPWGPDAAWSSGAPGGGVDWVAANSALTRAVVTAPGGMAAYRAEVDRVLTEAWSADQALDRIDEMVELIAPWHAPGGRQLETLRSLVAWQEDTMQAGLAGPDPGFGWDLRGALCMAEQGAISMSLDAPYGSLDGSARAGTCSGTLTWGPDTWPVEGGTAYAGGQDGYAVTACVLPLGEINLLTYLTQPGDELAPGAWPTEHTVSRMTLYYSSAETGWEWAQLSWVEGTWSVEAAGAATGADVRGSYTGTLWAPAW